MDGKIFLAFLPLSYMTHRFHVFMTGNDDDWLSHMNTYVRCLQFLIKAPVVGVGKNH